MVPNQIQPKEEIPKAHHNLINKNQSQRKNTQSNKRKETYHIQWTPTTAFSRFLNRNPAGQETVRCYIQSAKGKKKTKTKNFQPRILYPANMFFKHKDEIKTFPDIQKLREFINTRLVLTRNARGLLGKS